MTPTAPPPSKPPLPRRSFNFLIAQAGAAGARLAEKQGIDADSRQALLQEPAEIGGLVFPPYSLKTQMAVDLARGLRPASPQLPQPSGGSGETAPAAPASAGAVVATPPAPPALPRSPWDTDSFVVAEFALCFHDPEGATAYLTTAHWDAWVGTVSAFHSSVPLDCWSQIAAHIFGQLGLASRMAGTPAAETPAPPPPAEAGPDPANPPAGQAA